jgi:hypothetical protein
VVKASCYILDSDTSCLRFDRMVGGRPRQTATSVDFASGLIADRSRPVRYRAQKRAGSYVLRDEGRTAKS